MKIVATTITLFLTLVFASISSADSHQDMYRKLIGETTEGSPLSKASATQQVYYTNSSFNFEYTAPAGWSFDATNIHTGTSGAGIWYSTGNPSYPALQWMYIMGFRYGSNFEAEGLGYKLQILGQ